MRRLRFVGFAVVIATRVDAQLLTGNHPPASTLPSPAAIKTTFDSLQFAVEAWRNDASVAALVTIRNITERTLHLSWGSCSFILRLYSTPDRSDKQAWAGRPERGGICLTYRWDRELRPGQHLQPSEFRIVERIAGIAGDSLVADRYYVGAQVELAGGVPYARDTFWLRGPELRLRP